MILPNVFGIAAHHLRENDRHDRRRHPPSLSFTAILVAYPASAVGRLDAGGRRIDAGLDPGGGYIGLHGHPPGTLRRFRTHLCASRPGGRRPWHRPAELSGPGRGGEGRAGIEAGSADCRAGGKRQYLGIHLSGRSGAERASRPTGACRRQHDQKQSGGVCRTARGARSPNPRSAVFGRNRCRLP